MSAEQPPRMAWLARIPWPAAVGHREWYQSQPVATLIAAARVSVSVVVALHAPVPAVRRLFYLVAVLATSSIYGPGWGLAISLASALAFNFFFLAPRHTLVISSSGDWLALPRSSPPPS